ncbi:membrane-bound lytic murein transglycosylase B [Roseibium hamelinense]|uniref:Membrane-bound lytic murein transglycosylase B n=1 Tax=Roseibium hamelinense TaxID=150831 RepID=A0A562TGY0_9HYPH|nr:lytic murein transglycosylase [Roseibium hamelinense]TWI92855.1 membrane-bound lytic murein transglycosylase B [Roseibium hamelinense]
MTAKRATWQMAVAVAAALLTAPASAATCITSKGQFNAYKQQLAQQATRSGVGQRGLQALQQAKLSGITWRFESNPASQSSMRYRSPEQFLKSRFSSVNSFVSNAKRRLQQNARLFQSIEQRYGVPGSILVAIWGYETSWGGYTGKTPIVNGAVTLASYCRRHPRFEDDAIAALQLVDRGLINNNSRGGPSGELGHMQFLAGNWVRFAVDGNGDGRADPNNAADALATAANMLRRNGWRGGRSFADGSANFRVLSTWNDSGNYQRAIAYAAGLIDQ